MLGLIIGAAILDAAIEAAEDSFSYTTSYTPTVTTRTTTYRTVTTRPRIYDNRRLERVYFAEYMSDSSLERAFENAYKMLPSEMRDQIHACNYKREDETRCGIRTCCVKVSINYDEYVTVYYEIH